MSLSLAPAEARKLDSVSHRDWHLAHSHSSRVSFCVSTADHLSGIRGYILRVSELPLSKLQEPHCCEVNDMHVMSSFGNHSVA